MLIPDSHFVYNQPQKYLTLLQMLWNGALISQEWIEFVDHYLDDFIILDLQIPQSVWTTSIQLRG